MAVVKPLALALLFASLACAQTADGFIRIGADRRELRHARATHVPDDFDKSKQVIRLVLSEAPIPAKALFDSMALSAICSQKTNQIVEFDFHDGGVNWFLTGKEMEGTRSLSQSPNPFPYEITNGTIQGKIEAKSDPDDKNTPYEIAVTYTAQFEQAIVVPPPTPADAISAQKSPATKAYLNLIGAIRTGDRAKILAAAPPDQRDKIDTPDFQKMLKIIQMMQPENIKVLKAVEKDGVATLTLSGIQEGKPQKGEAVMKFEGGKWLMRNESWRAK